MLTLLKLLQVTGAHITADAMNTQKKTARKIHDKGGDYTLSLKDNHKTLRKEIQAYFHKVTRDAPDQVAVHEEVDDGHGRVEKRSCRQLPVSDWVSGAAKWPRLQTIIEMEREGHQPGKKVETEIHYYISSLSVDAQRVGRAYGGIGRWRTGAGRGVPGR